MMISVCSVEARETLVAARRSGVVLEVLAVANHSKASGIRKALMTLGKMARILVEKTLVEPGVAVRFLARVKTRKGVGAVNLSSHRRRALLLHHLRELDQKEVEEVEAQAMEKVEVGRAEVETTKVRVQEVEEAVLALVVLVEEALVIQCSIMGQVLDLLPHLLWPAWEDLVAPIWEAWNFSWPSCCWQTVLVQTLAVGMALPHLSHQA
jgi:hypothetical protein